MSVRTGHRILMSQTEEDTQGGIMATTTVRKGTHRASAKAKRDRAAQRTPLPAVNPQVRAEAGRRQAQVTAQDNLDSLGLPELKQLARAQGWSTLVDRGTKAQIAGALRKHPNGPPANAQPLGGSNGNGSKSKEIKVSTTEQSKVDPGQQVAARIAAARESGYSRKDIADTADLTQSVIWRMQAKGFVKPLELPKITEALGQIERGQVEPTRRGRPRGDTADSGRSGTRAALQFKLDQVHEALSEVPMNSNKPSEYREAITKALDVIDDNA